jgi:hypothetical protein
MLSQVLLDLKSYQAKADSLSGQCQKTYENFNDKLLNLAGSNVNLETSDLKSIDDDIWNVFESRLRFRKVIGEIPPACVKSASTVFSTLRTIEDYLIEFRAEKFNLSSNEVVSLKGEFPNLLINPKYNNDFKSYEDLKAHDVIVSNGSQAASTAILKSPRSESQIIETFSELGSVEASLMDHLSEKNARALIYRPLLNVEMQLGTDVSLDPRFEIVAEWRNPKKLEEARFKEYIFSKIAQKRDHNGYAIDGLMKLDPETKTLWVMRKGTLLKKSLEINSLFTISPALIESLITYDKVAEILTKNLELRSIEFDHPMTPKEINVAMDDFIKKDLDLYKKFKKGQDVEKPMFHLLFHP